MLPSEELEPKTDQVSEQNKPQQEPTEAAYTASSPVKTFALGIIRGEETKENEPDYLGRNADFLDEYFEACYGMLPQDHPLTRYVYQLNQKFPKIADVKFRILPGWREINAVAASNNTIYLSGGLMKFCQTDEELMFVLGHERTHLKKHFGKQNSEKKGYQKPQDRILSEMGRSRIKEWEADLRSVTEEMDQHGINAHGAKVFLKKLSVEPGVDSTPDIAHGSTIDRIVNIDSAIALIDFKHISHELTPKNVDAHIPFDANLQDIEEVGISKLGKEARTQFIREILEAAKKRRSLLPIGRHIAAGIDKIDFFSKREPEESKTYGIEIAIMLVDECKQKIDETFPNATAQEKHILLGFFISLAADVDLSFDSKNRALLHIQADLQNALETPDDFEKALELCSEENAEKFGASLHGNPYVWLQTIIKMALTHSDPSAMFEKDDEFNADAFFDFCKMWAQKLQNVMRQKGLQPLHETEINDAIFDIIDTWLPEDKLAELQRRSPSIEFLVKTSEKETEDSALERKRNALFINCAQEITSLLPGDIIERGDIEESTKEKIIETIDHFAKDFIELSPGINEKDVVLWINKMKDSAFDLDSWILLAYGFALLQKVKPDLNAKMPVGHFVESITHGQHTSDEHWINHKVKNTFSPPAWEGEKLSNEDFLAGLKKAFHPEERKNYWGIHPDDLDAEELSNIFINFIKEIHYRIDACKTIEEALQFFIDLQDTCKDPELKIFREAFNEVYPLSEMWSTILEKFPLDNTAQLSEPACRLLLIVTLFIEEYNRRITIQTLAIKRLLELKPEHTDQIHLLLSDEMTGRAGNLELRDTWIEHHEHTPAQLKEIRIRAQNRLEAMSNDENAATELGSWGLMDIVDNTMKNKNFVAFIGALINTESDENLKIILVKYFKKLFTLPAAMVLTDKMILNIQKMSAEARYAFLRIAFLGKNGIARDQAMRCEFLEQFAEGGVQQQEGEEDIFDFLKEILPILSEIDDPELFYAIFMPIAFKRFGAAQKKTDWEGIVELHGGDAKFIRSTMKKYTYLTENPEKLDEQGGKNVTKYMYITSDYDFIDKYFTLEQKQHIPSLRPLEAVIQIAKNLGAIGTRFLQLLGQYVPLDANYAKEFSGLYDSMRGQSELAAWHAITREWPEAENEIKTVKPRIGGGSLMTAYEVELVTGDRQIIKVLNPNLTYYLERVFGFLTELVEKFIASQKEKGQDYEALRNAVNDIKEWIYHDVDIAGFLEKDRKFREANHGFRANENPYSIGVPQTFGPENRYFMREEFVEGKNLTQWEKLEEEGHDMKAITSLLCKNYLAQIERGQVHADVHIGNIRITPDKQCTLLDRAGYLEFDENDQMLFRSFLTQNRDLIFAQTESYLKASNPEFSSQKFHRQIDLALEDASPEEEGPVIPNTFVFSLKQRGIKMPLKLTLLMKNLSVLEQMARKAGFAGFQEAVAA